MQSWSILLTILFTSVALPETPPAPPRRSPTDPKVLSRYLQAMEERPTYHGVFQKVFDIYDQHLTVEHLRSEYEKKSKAASENPTYLVILGHLAQKENNLKAAAGFYRQAMEHSGEQAYPFEVYADVLARLRDFESARQNYEESLRRQSAAKEKRDLLKKLADLCIRLDRPQEAVPYWDQLIELDPDNIFLRLELARIQADQGLLQQAIVQLEKAMELGGNNSFIHCTALKELGRIHEEMKQLPKAMESYEKALELISEDSPLHEELVTRVLQMRREQGTTPALILLLQASIEENPTDIQALRLLTRIHREDGNFDKALETLQKIARIAPKDIDLKREIVGLCRVARRFDLALEHQRELVQSDPEVSEHRLQLADLLFEKGDGTAAVLELESALERWPQDYKVHLAAAGVYERHHQLQKAEAAFQKAIALSPSAETYGQLAQFFFRSERPEFGQETVQQMTDWKKNAETLLFASTLLRQWKRTALAIQLMTEGTALEAQNPELWLTLGRLHGDQQDLSRASAALWQARKLALTDHLRLESERSLIELYKAEKALPDLARKIRGHFQTRRDPLNDGQFLLEVYKESGMVEQGLAAVNALVTLQPDRLAFRRWRKDFLAQQKNYEAALRELDQLIELDPAGKGRYMQEQSQILLQMDRREEALQKAVEAVNFLQRDGQLYFEVAQLCQRLGDTGRALNFLRKAARVQPERLEIRLALADLLKKDGQGETALHELVDALDAVQQPAEAQDLALAIRRHFKPQEESSSGEEQQTAQAAAAASQAGPAAPELPPERYLEAASEAADASDPLGLLLGGAQQQPEKILLEKIRLHRREPKYYLAAFAYYKAEKDFDRGRKILEEAWRVVENRLSLCLPLSEMCAQQNDLPALIQYLEAYLSLADQIEMPYFQQLALAQYRQEKYLDAYKTLLKARQRFPQEPVLVAELLALGPKLDPELARKLALESIDDPNDQIGDFALWLLKSCGCPEILPPVFKYLRAFRPSTRQLAAEVFARYAREEHAQELVEFVETEPGGETLRAFAEQLLQREEPWWAPVAERLLRSRSTEARALAAKWLRKRATLQRADDSSAPPSTRDALLALFLMESDPGKMPPLENKDLPALLRLLGSPEEPISRRAAQAIKPFLRDGSLSLSELSRILADPGTLPHSRTHAILAASEAGSAALLLFQRVLQESSQPAPARQAALQALLQTPDSEAHARILPRLLNDKDWLVRARACRALQDLGFTSELFPFHAPGDIRNALLCTLEIQKKPTPLQSPDETTQSLLKAGPDLQVTLRDGNRLAGKLSHIQTGHVIFQEAGKEPASIPADQIAIMALHPEVQESSEALPHLLKMKDGSQLPVRLLELTPETLVVDAGFEKAFRVFMGHGPLLLLDPTWPGYGEIPAGPALHLKDENILLFQTARCNGQALQVQSSFGLHEVPLDRVAALSFSKSAAEVHSDPGDVQVELANSARLQGQIWGHAPDGLSLASPTLGLLRLPLDHIRRIFYLPTPPGLLGQWVTWSLNERRPIYFDPDALVDSSQSAPDAAAASVAGHLPGGQGVRIIRRGNARYVNVHFSGRVYASNQSSHGDIFGATLTPGGALLVTPSQASALMQWDESGEMRNLGYQLNAPFYAKQYSDGVTLAIHFASPSASPAGPAQHRSILEFLGQASSDQQAASLPSSTTSVSSQGYAINYGGGGSGCIQISYGSSQTYLGIQLRSQQYSVSSFGGGSVQEAVLLSPEGNRLWSYSAQVIPFADHSPEGWVAVCEPQKGQVVVIDAKAGRQLLLLSGLQYPVVARFLPQQRVAVFENGRGALAVYDREGKKIWEETSANGTDDFLPFDDGFIVVRNGQLFFLNEKKQWKMFGEPNRGLVGLDRIQ